MVTLSRRQRRKQVKAVWGRSSGRGEERRRRGSAQQNPQEDGAVGPAEPLQNPWVLRRYCGAG